jgi:hypothetical protein
MTLITLDPVDDQVQARVSRPEFDARLRHIKPAAGCAQPIRLYGDMYQVKVNHDTGGWCVLTRPHRTCPTT